jgi:nicotinamide-nucleotide amidase
MTMKRITNKLMRVFREKGLTLALAESMTCGLMAHQLCNVVGTSEVLKGSIVCYHEEVKTTICKVPRKLVEEFTAESQQVTDELAQNLAQLFQADIYLAVTGLAGPGASEGPGKPVGTVFLSVFYQKKLHRKRLVLKGTPLEIRKQSCEAAYQMLCNIVETQTDCD